MIESVGFDGAVEVGVAAFCAGAEPPGDGDVWERLTGAGVEPWLAERLLAFLPMAFAGRLLPDVAFADGRAAAWPCRPSRCSWPRWPARSRPIAARSNGSRCAAASSNAVDNALKAGSNLSDLSTPLRPAW
ncbi:hypothetical protein [Actinomadura sp. 7K507]|uniref:hypothetical protein n=1 Tax=Actinomadura sp. 7K507 TaxID=2530365 RepID=UPI001A9D78B6|nr:hypothetical protein [Actinomadura sp. 7K507]